MPFTDEQLAALRAKLDASHVKTRTQAGRSLSYIEGWHAIAEANRIFGFDAWDRETVDLQQLGQPREVDGKWRVAYMAKVRVRVFAGERAIIREGCGYGSGIDKDLGAAHESALKEAETDAMKRALMTFGNPFGLALYDKEQAEVERNGHAAQKPAPMPEPAPGEPGKPITHTLRAEFVRGFWNRASYTVEVKSDRSGPNWTAWFDWMWQLGQAAPTLDCIVKLQDDNKANLAGFRLVSASEHRKLLDHFALVERAHGKVAA